MDHPALRNVRYDNGNLVWGDRTIVDLVEEYGTPLYVYDKARIAQRVETLRTAFPEELQLHYAMKANPFPPIVDHLLSLVDGLDVASAGELAIALEAGADPLTVSFAGPGKRDSELEAALDSQITFNLESEGETRRLARIADRRGIQPNVAIRINPNFELKGSGMKMGGLPSQFGIDAERVPGLITEIAQLGLNFRGFHVYTGSQNLRPEAIEESLRSTVALVLELASGSPLPVSFVNLGGGLGIPYFPKDRLLRADDVAEPVAEAVEALSGALDSPEIVMELGRYLVGEAGIYISRVTDVKISRGTKYVICDGGLHHHLAASGNFGQIIRKNYPLVAASDADRRVERVNVVGPLCTPLDILGDKVDLPERTVGSLVGVLQSGAYGPTASPRAFLTQPDCREILI